MTCAPSWAIPPFSCRRPRRPQRLAACRGCAPVLGASPMARHTSGGARSAPPRSRSSTARRSSARPAHGPGTCWRRRAGSRSTRWRGSPVLRRSRCWRRRRTLHGVVAADVALAARAYPGAKFDKKTERGRRSASSRPAAATHDEATAASHRAARAGLRCDRRSCRRTSLIALLTSARGGSPAASRPSAALRDDPPVRATRRIARGGRAARACDRSPRLGTVVILISRRRATTSCHSGPGRVVARGASRRSPSPPASSTACRGCRSRGGPRWTTGA